MRHVSETTGSDLQKLYAVSLFIFYILKYKNKMQNLGWPLYEKYGHAFNAFKIMVTDPKSIFNDISIRNETIDDSVKQALVKDICRRMTPQPLKIRADLEITCFEGDGIECIKLAMRAAEGISTEECKIKVSLIASPLYVVTTQTLNKEAGIAVMQKAIEAAMVKLYLMHKKLKFELLNCYIGTYNFKQGGINIEESPPSCE